MYYLYEWKQTQRVVFLLQCNYNRKTSESFTCSCFFSIVERIFYFMTNILVSLICSSLSLFSCFILYFICEPGFILNIKEGKIINNTTTFFSINV